jgi:hypothetical protein
VWADDEDVVGRGLAWPKLRWPQRALWVESCGA